MDAAMTAKKEDAERLFATRSELVHAARCPWTTVERMARRYRFPIRITFDPSDPGGPGGKGVPRSPAVLRRRSCPWYSVYDVAGAIFAPLLVRGPLRSAYPCHRLAPATVCCRLQVPLATVFHFRSADGVAVARTNLAAAMAASVRAARSSPRRPSSDFSARLDAQELDRLRFRSRATLLRYLARHQSGDLALYWVPDPPAPVRLTPQGLVALRRLRRDPDPDDANPPSPAY